MFLTLWVKKPHLDQDRFMRLRVQLQVIANPIRLLAANQDLPEIAQQAAPTPSLSSCSYSWLCLPPRYAFSPSTR